MDTTSIVMILLQIFLIALNAVFACAEIAIISMNDSKLAKLVSDGDKRAMRLARLTSQPARFLATIQVAITLSGFLGSAFAADNFSDGLVNLLLRFNPPVSAKTLDTIAVILITIVLSYFTLIFGELVPKRIAMRKAEVLALGMSALISGISKLFSPIVWFLTVSTNAVLRLLGIDPNDNEEEVSEEEIRMMVDVGSEKGTIDPAEQEYIKNVFEFDDLTAGEIVTHRTEISMLWLDDTMSDWEDTIHSSRHTLYPVCKDSPDDVIGILNAKDYFRLQDKSRENVMDKAVSPPYFVPECVKADVLFRNMKHDRNNLAVVLDEYGGMSGIVTINDLVELIVGDLIDEDNHKVKITPIEIVDSQTWKIHGSASLDDVAIALGITLPCNEYDTFNGFIFSLLGSIPQDGSDTNTQYDDLTIKVTDISDHQIKTAIVTKNSDSLVVAEV